MRCPDEPPMTPEEKAESEKEEQAWQDRKKAEAARIEKDKRTRNLCILMAGNLHLGERGIEEAERLLYRIENPPPPPLPEGWEEL